MNLPETCPPADLAISLGRSERWVLDAARDGRLPSLKVGGRVRFTAEMVDAIVASFTREGSRVEVPAGTWSRPARAVARSRARARRSA